jgi:voltage-gated potassium channel
MSGQHHSQAHSPVKHAAPPHTAVSLRALKRRLHEILDPAHAGDRTAEAVATAIIVLIILNVAAFVLGTVGSLARSYIWLFELVETATVAAFTAEYALRLWVCTNDERFAAPVRGRIRYALTPLAIIDVLAIAPFYGLGSGTGAAIFRVFRIARLAKLWRYSKSLQLLARVTVAKSEELLVATGLMLLALLVASTLLYYVERIAQPDVFSSIPAAMWWGVATLSTVGYGDIYPVTPLGKVLAGVFTFFGIAMFALPIAILSSAFAEEFERTKHGELRCPYCGHRID